MKRIGKLIADAIRNMEPDDDQLRYGSLEKWSEIAGEKLASLSSPVEFRNDVLFVRVKHPLAYMELMRRKEMILKKINSLYGKILFSDIRILTGINGR